MLKGVLLALSVLILGATACTPAAAQVSVPLSATLSSTPASLSTQTPSSAASLTSPLTPTPVETLTVPPSETQTVTQTFTLAVVVQPTLTHRAPQKKTPTATQTETETLVPSVTETAFPPLATTPPCPVPTSEPLWVDPVTSPTDQLSQTITVYIGYGEQVTVETESGRFTAMGNFDAYANPALVVINLLPNTVHHLQVFAKVRTLIGNGCPYGGYTLQTTTDRQANPLVIVQGTPSTP